MVIIVMGVAGCGKSTVGRLLAERLGATFHEGDDFHPPANREKMRRGVALTDQDRVPWLAALHETIASAVRLRQHAVVACSALRQRYRELLSCNIEPDVRFIYLRIREAEATRRLAARQGHYMPASLVPSQFATLEEPHDALTLDATLAVDRLVEQAMDHLILQR